MGFGKAVAPDEMAAVGASVRRLESRGVDRRRAVRRVATTTGTTTRYVRKQFDSSQRTLAEQPGR